MSFRNLLTPEILTFPVPGGVVLSIFPQQIIPLVGNIDPCAYLEAAAQIPLPVYADGNTKDEPALVEVVPADARADDSVSHKDVAILDPSELLPWNGVSNGELLSFAYLDGPYRHIVKIH